ncbi:MAG: hypothetical protein COB15_15780 [Flavobacteriales bacterium]|nr:MAG: hypothetical protein COB15_15780 [Flavobacteriales bacterium]
MRIYIKLILLLVLASLFTPVKCQVYPFKNFTVENGLSQSILLSIEQDSDGVIWLGTNNGGITKYNGTSYSYLTIKDSLPDNIIYCIEKDDKGNLWIGTNNGLSIYDGHSFKNYTTEDGLSHNRVYHIYFDQNKTPWIGTGQGVSIFKNDSIIPFNQFEDLNQALVISTYQDKNQVIWFSTLSHGLFSLENKKLTNYTEENGLSSKYVYSVNEDAKSNLYVFCHKGLFLFKDKKFTELLPGYFNENTAYYGAETDQFGSFWIATSRGVFKYQNDSFSHFTTDNGLIHNDIWKIINDDENNLWFISKSNGASMLRSERFYNYSNPLLKSKVIPSLLITSNNDLYIGTEQGLLIDNGKEVSFLHEKNGLPSNKIFSMLENGKRIWIGTNFGIAYIENGKITKVENAGSTEFLRCFKVFKDKDNQMWFGTQGGIAKYENNKIVPYKTGLITSKIVFDITQDSKGDYWLGTDDGLICYNGSSVRHFRKADGIKKGRVRTVLIKDNILWIGTPSGLYQYNGKQFTRYTEKDGLTSENIYSLTFDNNGALWAGLSTGIDKINIKNNKVVDFQYYGPEEGFIGQVCYLNSIAKDVSGKLYFGTDNGLMVYQPKYDIKNSFEVKTKIKEIELFSQQTDWHDYSDSVTLNNIPINLELTYDQNYLAFNYIGVSHSNSSKIKYQYQLKGFDKSWGNPTDKTDIIYSNLPHGDYEFLLKASNGEGVWNTTPISFKFTIHPPFWLTWWFFTICAIIFFTGVYSYLKIKAANKQILEKNEIIEEKNNNILDSINYAQKIQQAILPPIELLKEQFKDHFVLYQPKDIVSGDFYWLKEKGDKVLIAAVDCTGHGVPGAMVSVVGYTGLNRAINEFNLEQPGDILDKLNHLVVETLNQAKDNQVKDGMDIALCLLDKKENELIYSGANNPLYLIRKGNTLIKKGEEIGPSHSIDDNFLFEIKADKQPIGLFEHRKDFTNHSIKLQEGDSIYIFSDGYQDQFGGPKGKKFRIKQFRELLFSLQNEPMQQQKEQLDITIKNWMGDLEQVDDICVIGIKI